MKGISLFTPPAMTLDDGVVYPESDGKPMAETEAHILLMVTLIATLRNHFAARGNVYVIGNMFLYYQQGDPKACVAPDVMVVKDVDTRVSRRVFKSWEENALPCVTFELTSKGTANEDLRDKRALYQELGVREYFLYDPLHEYLPNQLMGFRLVQGEYEAIRLDDTGSMISAELGMRLVPEGKLLALFDLATGSRVPTPEETHELWEQARHDVEQLRLEVGQAQKERDEALQRAAVAERRVQELEAQVRKLQERSPGT